MSLISVSGVVAAPDACPSNLHNSLQKIASSLGERFDRVNIGDRSVEADATSLTTLLWRGSRTHPMLPFNRVRVEAVGGDPKRLIFSLNIKIQIVIFLYLAVAFGLMASIDSGPIKGFAIGVAFATAAFLLNFLIARHRALEWLSREWARASLSPDI